MNTIITFNKLGQEVKREQPFSFEVHYVCTTCGDCPDFESSEWGHKCQAQGNDLFFRNFQDPYGSIHPKCPKRKEAL